MSVKVESGNRRSVQVEVEVPGTPEAVWRAVATGPGISCWFVPTQVEERVGGKIVASFGPGMDSRSKVAVWHPPRLFAAESRDDMAAGDPTVTTEWSVEPRAAGRCLVRLVHRWVTEKDTWDAQFEQHEQGWIGFFRLLRLYLAHFADQHCTAFQLMATAPEPKAGAWRKLAEPLGLLGVPAGGRVQAPAEAPPLAGAIEHVGPPEWPEEALVCVDQPAPGFAHLYAMPMGGQVFLSVRFFLFGPQAAAAASRAEAAWGAWLQARFPAPPA